MIWLARHGDRAFGDNYNARLNIADDPLSEKGLGDAQRIAAYFRDTDIRKIYTSQYVRTQQTAKPTAQGKGLDIIVDARINEINSGLLHRRGEEAFAAEYPELWHNFKNHLCDVKFPEGESGTEVKARIDSFLEDMKGEKDDILAFSHDGAIRLLLCSILGLPVWMRYKFISTMGGISAIEYDGTEWRIRRFNQIV